MHIWNRDLTCSCKSSKIFEHTQTHTQTLADPYERMPCTGSGSLLMLFHSPSGSSRPEHSATFVLHPTYTARDFQSGSRFMRSFSTGDSPHYRSNRLALQTITSNCAGKSVHFPFSLLLSYLH